MNLTNFEMIQIRRIVIGAKILGYVVTTNQNDSNNSNCDLSEDLTPATNQIHSFCSIQIYIIKDSNNKHCDWIEDSTPTTNQIYSFLLHHDRFKFYTEVSKNTIT